MKKFSPIIFSIFFLLISFSIVLAEDASPSSSKDRIQEVMQKREDKMTDMMEKKDEVKNEMEAKKAELRDKLSIIRDEKRQQRVGALSDKIQTKNDRWTRHASKILERLQTLLDKVISRTDKVENNVNDVSSVRTTILDAQSAIDAALLVVGEQADKVYEIEITDEASLGDGVSATIAELRTDMAVVKVAVNTAKDAVHDALKMLVAVRSSDEGASDTDPTVTIEP